MKLVGEYTYKLTSAHYSLFRELKPYGYFDMFQDMASKHAESLNVDYDTLFPKGIIWVLARVKYEMINKITPGMKIVGKTWPHPSGRFDSIRDYLLLDESGNIMAKGSSLWCLVNFNNGRLLPTNVAPIEGDFYEESVFENKLEKISYDENKLVELGSYKVVLSDIDWNGHMNNAKYTEVVFNLLSKEEARILKGMEVNYLLQMFLDEEMALKGYRNEKEIIIVGYKGEHACFIAKCILD